MTPTGDTGQQPGGLRFGNLVFDLSAYLNGGQLAGYVFPQPVTVVITYNPALLSGLDAATLALLTWDETAWAGDGIVFVGRDLNAHTLTVTLAHLSEFALFAAPDTPPEQRLYLPAVMREATGFTTQTADGVTDDGTTAPAPAPEAMGAPDAATDEAAAAPPAATQQLHLPLIVQQYSRAAVTCRWLGTTTAGFLGGTRLLICFCHATPTSGIS